MPPQSVENLKAEVQQCLVQGAPGREFAPGSQPAAAIQFGDVFAKLDGFFQRLEPVLQTFTPQQYQAVLESVIALVHSLSGAIKPTPAS